MFVGGGGVYTSSIKLTNDDLQKKKLKRERERERERERDHFPIGHRGLPPPLSFRESPLVHSPFPLAPVSSKSDP